jgi:hypothetical protein
VVRKSTRKQELVVQAVHQRIRWKMVHQEVQEIQELVVSWFIRTNGLNGAGTSGRGFRNTGVSGQVVHQEIQELVVKRSSGIKWKWYIRKFRKYRS